MQTQPGKRLQPHVSPPPLASCDEMSPSSVASKAKRVVSPEGLEQALSASCSVPTPNQGCSLRSTFRASTDCQKNSSDNEHSNTNSFASRLGKIKPFNPHNHHPYESITKDKHPDAVVHVSSDTYSHPTLSRDFSSQKNITVAQDGGKYLTAETQTGDCTDTTIARSRARRIRSLLFIRHGHSIINNVGYDTHSADATHPNSCEIQSSHFDPPLTAGGRRQIQDLRHYFEEHFHVPFDSYSQLSASAFPLPDLVVVSPLLRAMETAQLLFEQPYVLDCHEIDDAFQTVAPPPIPLYVIEHAREIVKAVRCKDGRGNPERRRRVSELKELFESSGFTFNPCMLQHDPIADEPMHHFNSRIDYLFEELTPFPLLSFPYDLHTQTSPAPFNYGKEQTQSLKGLHRSSAAPDSYRTVALVSHYHVLTALTHKILDHYSNGATTTDKSIENIIFMMTDDKGSSSNADEIKFGSELPAGGNTFSSRELHDLVDSTFFKSCGSGIAIDIYQQCRSQYLIVKNISVRR